MSPEPLPRRIAASVAAILVFLFGRVSAPAQEVPTVRVVTNPNDQGSEVYDAQAMGFFKRVGLNVIISGVNLSNGATIVAAVAGGAADIGQSNIISVAQAHEHGVPVVFIAPANLYISTQHQAALLVRKDSSIDSARALDGETVVISGLGGISYLGAVNWIDKNGGDSKTVRFLELPLPAMAAALADGRVDAALLSEPQLDAALASGRFRVLADPYPAIADNYLVGGWFASSDWARSHRDAVRAFATAMQMAARWSNAHPQQSGAILAKATGFEMGATVARTLFSDRSLDATKLQPLLAIATKYGLLKGSLYAAEIIFR